MTLRHISRPAAALTRFFIPLALLLAALGARGQAAPGPATQTPPSLERGFKPEKLYNVLGLDTINPFNGNLMIGIPIGPQYPNDGGMTYGLTLSYNSKLWDYQPEWGYDAAADPPTGRDYMLPLPSRRANAGFGWLLSMGRLISPDDVMHWQRLNDPNGLLRGCDAFAAPMPARCIVADWVYESPDGADHPLRPNYQGREGTTYSYPRYSDDRTYLRLKPGPLADGKETMLLEFPDGSEHTFINAADYDHPGAWKLWEIRDAFGNLLTIRYDNPYDDLVWTITDKFGRVTTVTFSKDVVAPRSGDIPPKVRKLVQSVDLPAPATPDGTARRMTYTFTHDASAVELTPGCAGWTPAGLAAPKVKFLNSITLPDGSQFAFTYDRTDGPYDMTTLTCAQGAIRSMTLPTGGRVEWTYQPYALSMGSCRDMQWASFVPGVQMRTLINDQGPPSVWKYDQGLDDETTLRKGAPDNCRACSPEVTEQLNHRLVHIDNVHGWSGELKEILTQPRAESKTTVTTPGGDTVEHFFSTLPENEFLRDNTTDDDPGEPVWCNRWNGAEVGLSISRKPRTTPVLNPIILSDGKKAYLSTISNDCTSGPCVPKRATYVRYEIDGSIPLGRTMPRLVAQRTVYLDDGGRWVDTFYSEADGYGHHRVVRTKTNITVGAPYERITTTKYEATSNATGQISGGALFFQPGNQNWLLGRYSEVKTEDGQQKAGSLYTFDATGFLEERRVLRNLATGASADGDVVVRYTKDGGGNVAAEEWGLQAGSSVTTQYRADHHHLFGVRDQSRVTPQPGAQELLVLDLDIDQATGLPRASRDPAGVPTFYDYDAFARLVAERIGPAPHVGGRSQYVYHNATTAGRPWVEIIRLDRSGQELARSEVRFDAYGRVDTEKQKMASGDWSVRRTLYDLDGLKDTVSEAGRNAPHGKKTTFVYDAFARPLKVIAPDNSVTKFEYKGIAQKKTFVDVGEPVPATVSDPTMLTSLETYDGFGRLIDVSECSAAPSCEEAQLTLTRYGYDIADRLISVNTLAQARKFVYDGAGFLQSEKHPEIEGLVTYESYDAKGHPAAKVTGPFRLTFSYDGAERLRATGDGTHVLQEFTYDSVADSGCTMPTLGRLTSATRHNQLSDGDHAVTNLFCYDEVGRVARKTTLIDGQTFRHDFDYTDLGQPARINFPTCAACPAFPGARNISLTYANGFLRQVAGFTSATQPIDYHPSGLLASLQHASSSGTDLVRDVRVEDPNGMARPASIELLGARSCSLITARPTSQDVNPDTHTAQLGVAAEGTNIQYTWYQGERGDTSTPVASTPSFETPALTATTKYWVRVSENGTGCKEDSETVEARVCGPIHIIEDPSRLSRTLSGAATVTISVVVDGGGADLTYAWFLNNEPAPTLHGRIVDVNVNGTVRYKVRITSRCSDVMSDEAVFTVAASEACPAPTFKLDLPSAALLAESGEAVNLEVRMAGAAPLDQGEEANGSFTYQWYRNGAAMPGQTAHTLTYGGVNGDVVYVKVTKTCAATQHIITSHKTHVSVYGTCPLPPLVVDRKTIELPSDDAVFTASCDWPNVSYQWFHGESGDTRVPVTTDSTANSRYTADRPGAFWVRATAACGTKRDSEAVTVTRATCGPIRVTSQPHSSEVAAGSTVTLSIDATATPPLFDHQYQWFEGDGTDAPRGYGPSLTVNPVRTTSYWVRVENLCDRADSIPAVVHVTSCGNIVVNQQPADVSVVAGATASMSIGAAAAAAGEQVRYQWFEGESGDVSHPVTTVPANGPGLSIAPPKTTRYWVRLSLDRAGTCAVDSRTVTVNVCRTPVLLHAMTDPIVAPGQRAYLFADVEGDNLTYSWFKGELGVESEPAGSGPRITVNPVDSAKYWVKVVSDCAAPVADAVLQAGPVTISRCPVVEPATAAQTVVMRDATTTLYVNATGGGLTYRWFAGPRETPTLIGTTASITTPPITANTVFWCQVTSGNCMRPSAEVAVSICSIPSVAFNAVEQHVRSGQSQVLSAGVDPVEGTTITFYKGTSGSSNSEVLAGPTTSFGLAIAPTVTTSYWARARNGNCWSDTPTLTINVCVPTIKVQPQPATVNANTTAHLSVTADGGTLHYAWFEGERGVTTTPVGTDSEALDIVPPGTRKYWVRVSGSCGASADSDAVTVTVCAAPQVVSITRPSIPRGQTQTLTVNATGSGLHYQWYQGAAGTTTTPVGTDSSSYTVTTSQTTDYWVRVTDACGNMVDGSTTLSIIPLITTPPASRRFTRNTTVTFSVAVDSNRQSYQWYQGAGTANPVGTNAPSFTTPALTATASYWVRVTSGDAFVDSNLVTATLCDYLQVNVSNTQVSGASVQLSIVNPESGVSYTWYRGPVGDTTAALGNGTSITVNPTQTTSYWVLMNHPECYAWSTAINVSICTPAITQPPQNANITSGQSATLSVSATGDAPLKYQWYTGASGVTTNPVSPGNTQSIQPSPTSTTSYWVRVTNPAGTCAVNSTAATVTVCQLPQITQQPTADPPVNSGQNIGIHVTATGTSLSYQWYLGQPGDTSRPMFTNTATPVFAATQSDTFWVRVSGACGSVNSNAVTVSVYPIINQPPQSIAITSGTTATFSVAVTGSMLSYQWYQGSDMLTPVGTSSSSYTTPALTANTSYWVRVRSGNAYTNTAVATASMCAVPTVTIYNATGVSGQMATLSVDNPVAGDNYAWYLGSSGNTSSPITTGTPNINVYPDATTSYWVRVQKPTCTANSATVTVAICTPRITQQPQNGNITLGENKTLSVTAVGTAPLLYQWYAGASGVTSNPVGGATTSPSITVAPTSTTSYWVQVRGTCPVNSTATTVTVCIPPSISQQPQPAVVQSSGLTGALSVSASGTGLTYQWYRGASGNMSSPVSGATGSTYSQATYQTEYFWVRVSGSCNTANSVSVPISLRPSPTIEPATVAVGAGSTARFTATSGGNYLHYQWYRGDGTAVGTDSPSYVTPSLSTATSYYCVVTSGTASNQTTAGWATICDDGPPILAQPTATNPNASGCRTLSVSAGMPLVASYRWYRGPRGDTSTFAGNGSEVSVCATAGATYWCRVTNGDSGCYTDSQAISFP